MKWITDYIKKNAKRILMTVFGVLIGGFCVGMFSFSQMGVDPFQVLAHGIWMKIVQIFGDNISIGGSFTVATSFGNLYTVINALMLIAIIILDRKKIGLGTVINIFLLGYVVDFSTNLWTSLIPNPSLVIRIAFLVVAIIVICFGSSLYFTANMGVSTYDAVALMMSEKQKVVKFKYCRIFTDLICVIIGFILGANFGSGYTQVGTIITAFFMGPIISFFNNKVAIPFLYGKNNIMPISEGENQE